ncbi:MAG: serine/threonine protein kinase [Polyangiaceae bacterium]|nr:serine/threonine protein kinase [Polyangiaceae bacterium]
MSSSNESTNITVGTASVSNMDVDKANEKVVDKAEDRARAIIGTVISGRYRIVDLIATGGMGAVYLGEHVHMHKRIAVKILHPEVDEQPEIVARFEREAVVGAHVRHPNIANATDFGKLDDGAYFLVLDYIEGRNLGDLICDGPMPVDRVVRIAKQLAGALAAAHALGIVHRDMKPRNIMLDKNMVPHLIDFGFAKMSADKLPLTATRETRPASRLTGVGVIFGTIRYLAPESAHGMDAVDERADLYALGVIMYEMLAGKHPFDSTDPVEMFNHHRVTLPPPFSERAPGVNVPSELDGIIRKLLEKDPYERYQTAKELVDALEVLPFGHEPEEKRKSAPPPTPPAPAVEGDSEKLVAPSKPASTTTKKKKKKSAKAKPAANGLTYALAVIAVLAVAAAVFFAMR